jgi:hypothetical protein
MNLSDYDRHYEPFKSSTPSSSSYNNNSNNNNSSSSSSLYSPKYYQSADTLKNVTNNLKTDQDYTSLNFTNIDAPATKRSEKENQNEIEEEDDSNSTVDAHLDDEHNDDRDETHLEEEDENEEEEREQEEEEEEEIIIKNNNVNKIQNDSTNTTKEGSTISNNNNNKLTYVNTSRYSNDLNHTTSTLISVPINSSANTIGTFDSTPIHHNHNYNHPSTPVTTDNSNFLVVPSAGAIVASLSQSSSTSPQSQSSNEIESMILTSPTKLGHRKQHSMSDGTFQPLTRNSSAASESEGRIIKKNKKNEPPPTQSLSNITSPPLSTTYSASASRSSSNDLKKLNRSTFKDEYSLSYRSEDNLNDNNSLINNNVDKTSLNLIGFDDYSQLMSKPPNIAVFLNYILSDSSESPKYLVNILFSLFILFLLNFLIVVFLFF